MKKLTIISILLVLSLALLNAASVGLITSSKGKVRITRNAKDIQFKVGDPINNKDEIRTGAESFASYKYVDGASTVKVFSNSYVMVTAARSGKNMHKNVNVQSGSVHTKVTPGSGGKMEVNTPNSVASVKGTELFTSVNEDQESTFIVTKGTVNVSVFDNDQTEDVAAGFTAFVDMNRQLVVRETTEEDLAKLDQAELEAIQESMPKTIRIQLMDEAGNIKYIDIMY